MPAYGGRGRFDDELNEVRQWRSRLAVSLTSCGKKKMLVRTTATGLERRQAGIDQKNAVLFTWGCNTA